MVYLITFTHWRKTLSDKASKGNPIPAPKAEHAKSEAPKESPLRTKKIVFKGMAIDGAADELKKTDNKA
jgi:hypothetical protein